MDNVARTTEVTRRTLMQLGLTGAALTGVGSLAACTTGPDGGAAPVPSTDSSVFPEYIHFDQSPPDLAGANGSSDGYLHYPADPAVTVPEPPGDGQPITALASIWVPARPSIEDNQAWQHLNTQLGSEFQFQQIPAADYNARFATAMSGGDLPSMVEIKTVAKLPDLLRAKFIDLSEHLSGSAIRTYPNLANLPTTSWQAGVFNNAIYGIPTDRGMWQTSIMMQRSDLIAAKGLDASQITDFEDFVSLCTELTDERSSVWALSQVPIAYVRQMLGIPNVWRLDNGALTSAWEVEEQEEALNACRRLWQAGVVHPDAFAFKGAESKQLFGSGRTLLTQDSYPAWFQFHREQTVGETFDLDGLPLPGYDGGTAGLHLGKPAYGIAGIPKGHEDRVETILKVWDYLVAPFGSAEHLSVIYGQEGVDYELDGSDPVQTDVGLRETLSLVTLTCAPRVAYYPNDSEVAEKFYDHMLSMAENAVADPALYRFSDTQSSKGPELERQITSDFNDIIQDRRTISDWADSVATWRSEGGDQIRTELEAVLAAE